MCRELEMLDKKYGGETKEMSPQDVERADILYHALKSAATYHAMKDADVFIGVSAPNIVSEDMVRSMASIRIMLCVSSSVMRSDFMR